MDEAGLDGEDELERLVPAAAAAAAATTPPEEVDVEVEDEVKDDDVIAC